MNKYQEAIYTVVECYGKRNIYNENGDLRRYEDGDYHTDEKGNKHYLGTAIENIQELVDKATPKHVYLEGDGYADGSMVYDIAYCPSCGELLTESDGDLLWSAAYCPYCGQALDWGKE